MVRPVQQPLVRAVDWPWAVPAGWPSVCEMDRAVVGFGVTDNLSRTTSPRGGRSFAGVVERSGWPLRSLVSVRFRPPEPFRLWPDRVGWNFQSINAGLLHYGGGTKDVKLRWLPLRPLWIGFSVNTTLFAGLWALLLFGPSVAWRLMLRRRTTKGWCVGCGYDLAASKSPKCPECGLRRQN